MLICPHCKLSNLVGEIFCEGCGLDLQPHSPLDEHMDDVLLDIIPPRDPVVVNLNATAGKAARLMKEANVGCALVVDCGKLCGVITERDFVEKVIGPAGADLSLTVAQLMTPDPVVLSETCTVAVALNQMYMGQFRHLPVVNEKGNPTGVYSARDVLEELYHFGE